MTLIMATLQYSSGRPRVLVFMWMFFDPQNPPKHCVRQNKCSNGNSSNQWLFVMFPGQFLSSSRGVAAHMTCWGD